MKYIRKVNDFFINFLIGIVYIVGIGAASLIKNIFEKNNTSTDTATYWVKTNPAPRKKELTSPY